MHKRTNKDIPSAKPIILNQASDPVVCCFIMLIFFLWITVWLLATGLLALLLYDQYSLLEVMFEATSALGSVGLSVGMSHPDLSWAARLLLSLLMWMGRLEIMSVLVLLGLPFSRIKGYATTD